MDYKLALELKEVGYKQEGGNYFRCACRKWTGIEKMGECKCKDDKFVYVPTLSELIEACGDEFLSLTYDWDCKEWYARGNVGKIVRGEETPEIAVAKLFIKLNKK